MKRAALEAARNLAVAAAFSLLCAAFASAQTRSTTATDLLTPLNLAPGDPAGSYSLSGFEDVNLFNGNLNFHLPLLRVGGRGAAGYQMALAINSKGWSMRHTQTETSETWTPTHDMLGNTDGDYSPGKMFGRKSGFEVKNTSFCPNVPLNKQFFQTTLTTITFVTANGTEYDFRDQLNGGQRLAVTETCPSWPYQGQSRGTVWLTADGSGVTFISDAAIYDQADIPSARRTFQPSGYMLFKDGTRYRIDSGNVSWIRDRNGNTVTFGGGAFAADSLGRTVTVELDVTDPTYGLCDRIHYSGYGGAPRTIYVTKGSLGNALRPGYSLQTGFQLFPTNSTSSSQQNLYNPTVFTGVVLPNGRSYQLRYNAYGELARVVLPTGGAIEYDMVPGSGIVEGNNGQTSTYEIFRRVMERRTYPDGSTLEGRTVYTEYTYPSPNYVEVKSYSGSTLIGGSRHYFSGGTASANTIVDPLGTYPAWDLGREIATEQYATDGVNLTARLRLVTTSWQPNGMMGGLSVNPVAATTATTLTDVSPNLVAKTTAVNPVTGALGYDLYNNQTDLWEYDYGSGTPPAYALRHTHTDYLVANSVNGIDYTSQSGAHIRSLARAQQVYSINPQNGAETLAAQSETRYDEYGLTTYGSVTGWNDPGTAARGLATTQRQWLDTSSAWLESHATYDQVGNAVSTTDPRGITSYVSFADSFSDSVGRGTYALPTSTTSAIPAPSPGPNSDRGSNTPLTTSTVYDYCSGQIYSSTDANTQTIYAQYSGALDRLTQITRPDGGQTTYEYQDDPVAGLYLRTLTRLDAARSVEARQYFDGLGRGIRSFVYDGATANPWSVTDTYYDALGRAAKISNLYKVTSPSASVPANCAACTTKAYDALGRVVTVTAPDGGTVSTSYNGNQVTATDQAGKQRRSVSDGLDRLVRVVEDPAGLNYQTNYYYDALGNLRKVDQGGQQRFFMYDSLSRLVRARNPEQDVNATLALTDNYTAPGDSGPNSQWTTGYSYDPDGNVATRTDARNVMAIYEYDNLNRPVKTSYTDGTPYTLNTYDFATNGRGRYFADYESSTQGTLNFVFAYDAMGRPVSRKTNFYLAGTGWIDGYAMTREYDLAGNVTRQTYPSGHSVSYSYDAAGRVGDYGVNPAFTGNLGDGVQRTYVTGVSYDEASRLRQERFGTQTALYHKLHYNVRGQLYDVRLSTVQWQIDTGVGQWDWNRGALINYYSQNEINSPSNEGRYSSGPENNGNLRRADVYVPTDPNSTYDGGNSYGSFYTAQNTYSYDALNRLTLDSEANYNTASGWGPSVWQGYGYDQWGNRWISSASTGVNNKQFSVNAATNRLAAPSGQSGVMGYDYAGNLTYDTYSDPLKLRGAMTYDAENRMTSAQGPSAISGSYTSRYVYDAQGHRMRRQQESGETWQISGFDGELVAEYAGGAMPIAPRKEYGYRNGGLLVVADSVAADSLSDSVWVEDSLPTGATGYGDGEGWSWVGSSPAPASGSASHQSNVVAGLHQHYFAGATQQLTLSAGENLVAYVYLDPVNVPTEVMLQWNDGSWEHRAYWGANQLLWGADNTEGRRYIGALPPAGQWVRLEVPAEAVGLVGHSLQGMAFTLVGGRATWDRAGKAAASGPQWLVADHLGTPRMIADKSGDLAGIKRHDYLPFGEELQAGSGGRTQGEGYGNPDAVKQHFTGKVRDNETGLDCFGARYYTSTQGRFTGVDPLIASGMITNPQTWNRYTYTLNNPLAFVDPNGKWPTNIHNDIIDAAFPGLSEAERGALKAGSTDVDYGDIVLSNSIEALIKMDPSRFADTTKQEKANEHAMRMPGQTVEQAEKAFNEFVNKNMLEANAEQNKWARRDPYNETGNWSGFSPESLRAFGKGAHALMDSTSPAHKGFQLYAVPKKTGMSGIDAILFAAWYKGVRDHKKLESVITPQQKAETVQILRSYFRRFYGERLYQRAIGEQESHDDNKNKER